eukprot:gene2626-1624_t
MCSIYDEITCEFCGCGCSINMDSYVCSYGGLLWIADCSMVLEFVQSLYMLASMWVWIMFADAVSGYGYYTGALWICDVRFARFDCGCGVNVYRFVVVLGYVFACSFPGIIVYCCVYILFMVLRFEHVLLDICDDLRWYVGVNVAFNGTLLRFVSRRLLVFMVFETLCTAFVLFYSSMVFAYHIIAMDNDYNVECWYLTTLLRVNFLWHFIYLVVEIHYALLFVITLDYGFWYDVYSVCGIVMFYYKFGVAYLCEFGHKHLGGETSFVFTDFTFFGVCALHMLVSCEPGVVHCFVYGRLYVTFNLWTVVVAVNAFAKVDVLHFIIHWMDSDVVLFGYAVTLGFNYAVIVNTWFIMMSFMLHCDSGVKAGVSLLSGCDINYSLNDAFVLAGGVTAGRLFARCLLNLLCLLCLRTILALEPIMFLCWVVMFTFLADLKPGLQVCTVINLGIYLGLIVLPARLCGVFGTGDLLQVLTSYADLNVGRLCIHGFLFCIKLLFKICALHCGFNIIIEFVIVCLFFDEATYFACLYRLRDSLRRFVTCIFVLTHCGGFEYFCMICGMVSGLILQFWLLSVTGNVCCGYFNALVLGWAGIGYSRLGFVLMVRVTASLVLGLGNYFR